LFKFHQIIDSVKGKTLGDVLYHARNYFTGDFATKALGIISLPIFTHLLDTSDYGVVAIFLTTVGLTCTIATLNLTDCIGRYFYDVEHSDFGRFLSSIIQTTGLLLLSVIVFLFLIRNQFMSMLELSGDLFYFFIFALIFAFAYKIFRSIHIAQKLSKPYVKVNIIKGYASFGFSALLLIILTGPKYLIRLAGILIVQFFIGIWIVVKSLPFIAWGAILWKHIKYSIKFSLPRLPYVLSGTILGHFDRIMLGKLGTLADAGIYSVAYNVGALSLLVVASITPALIPNFYKLMNDKDHDEVDGLNNKILWIICASAACLTIIGGPLLRFLAAEKFHGGAVLIPYIILGYVFFALAQVYNRFAGYYKVTILQSIAALAAGALNIYLNYIYIPKFGMIASAYTTAISYGLLAVISFTLIRVFIKGHSTPIHKVLAPVAAFGVFIVGYIYIIG
jgi:O-antigen/teichoic acid export membrane protein